MPSLEEFKEPIDRMLDKLKRGTNLERRKYTRLKWFCGSINPSKGSIKI
jgi:hypothetical protein